MRIVALTLLVPALAAAQELLYVNPAPLVTASRLVALGGASVGLAENSESLPFNYAAVAQRHPRRKGVDFDLTAAVLFSPFPQARDIDNEGTAPDVVAPVESQFGGFIQFKRFGIGGYLRLSRKGICTSMPCISSTTMQGAAVFGFNAVRDQLVFGMGIFLARADFDVADKTYSYVGYNLGGGMLYRPNFLPFRIGIHGVSQTVGQPGFDPATVPPLGAGRTLFRAVISPARISLGASARFGAGSWRFNRLSPSALREMPDDYNFATVPHDLDPDDPRPPGRVLLSIALDVIFPVKNATTLTPFLLGTTPVSAGDSLYLVPRVGIEVEAIDHRLRLRSGGYLEPPFLAGSAIRPHGTFGTELFLFRLLADWSISASTDFAARYLSLSFGIGWWT